MNERGDDGSLDDLNTRLNAARSRREEKDSKSRKRRQQSDIGAAMRVGIDLVSGIVVGVLIGLGLDSLFGTSPVLMLVFFVLGSAAGISNVMRTARKMQSGTDDTTDADPPGSETEAGGKAGRVP